MSVSKKEIKESLPELLCLGDHQLKESSRSRSGQLASSSS